jgi:DNA polymerase elongation subunit (family B)
VYGCLGLSSWRFYDRDNAEAVTITGQTVIKTTGKIVNDYYNKKLKTERKDYVIYMDTDSVARDSKLIVNGEEKSIECVYDDLLKDDMNVFIEDITKREFIFPINLSLPYYDKNDIKIGKVQYIERHKIKKKMFCIKSKSGKCVKVTEDHSIMVIDESGNLIQKTPKELKKEDKIVVLDR